MERASGVESCSCADRVSGGRDRDELWRHARLCHQSRARLWPPAFYRRRGLSEQRPHRWNPRVVDPRRRSSARRVGGRSHLRLWNSPFLATPDCEPCNTKGLIGCESKNQEKGQEEVPCNTF